MRKSNYVWVRQGHEAVEAWTDGQLLAAAVKGTAPKGKLTKYVRTDETAEVKLEPRIAVIEPAEDETLDGGSQAELPIEEPKP